MEYIIAIDETGTFSWSEKSKSFVGGSIFKTIYPEKIKQQLKKCSATWNDTHKTKTRYPADFHYAPLCFESARNKYRGHLSLIQGKQFADYIIKNILNMPHIYKVFHTKNFPTWYSNEQQCYLDLLKVAIFGVLSENLKELKKDNAEIKIFIATRRIDELIGFWGKEHKYDYEKLLKQKLEVLIKKSFKILGKKIDNKRLNIKFDSATRNSFLIIADFVLANLKYDIIEFNKTEKLQTYDYNNYFLDVISDKPKLFFQRIWVEGKYSIAINGALNFVLNFSKKYNQLEEQINSWLTEYPKDKKNELFDIFNKYISEFRELTKARGYISNPIEKAYRKTMILLQFIEKLEKLNIKKEYLTLRLKVYKLLTSIESHRGVTLSENKWNKKYLNLYDRSAELVYPNILDRIKDKLEFQLANCQLESFNRYQFKKIINEFETEWLKYKELIDTGIQIYGKNNSKDLILGKISGNLGQAHGFLNEIEPTEQNFKNAEQYFINDLENIKKYTNDWDQGLTYLILLYWKFGDFTKSLNLFCEQLKHKNIKEKKLFDLSGKNSLIDYSNSKLKFWHLSNQIRLLARAIHEKRIKQDTEKLIKLYDYIYKKGDGFYSYPCCIIRKWLGYLLITCQEYKRSLNILEEKKYDDNFTVRTLYIPNFLLMVYSNYKLNNKKYKNLYDTFIENVTELRNQETAFDKYLTAKNFDEKYKLKNIQKWDLYKLCCLPPFYYA